MNAPPKEKPPTAKTEAAQVERHDDHSSTPYAVLVPTRKARKVIWRRFASYAGALAEARQLRGQGIAATVEGPQL
jgi:hypothetical protein